MTAEPKYDMTVHPTHALVRSQSNGAAAHQVTFPSCDCADFINRRGRLIEVDGGLAVTLCKHVAEGMRRIGGWHRDEPAGMDRATASGVLLGVGIARREANRALREAAFNGSSYADGLATGPLLVRHEGGTDDGLFFIGPPA